MPVIRLFFKQKTLKLSTSIAYSDVATGVKVTPRSSQSCYRQPLLWNLDWGVYGYLYISTSEYEQCARTVSLKIHDIFEYNTYFYKWQISQYVKTWLLFEWDITITNIYKQLWSKRAKISRGVALYKLIKCDKISQNDRVF